MIEAVAKAEGFEATMKTSKQILHLQLTSFMEVERVRPSFNRYVGCDIVIKKAVELITSTAKVK